MGKNSKSVQNKRDKRAKKIARTNKRFKNSLKKHVIKSDLNSLLQSIYNDKIDLSTTCAHHCECCKTACPSMNYCEFLNIITDLWPRLDKQGKIDLICKSVEYFFKTDYEKFNREIFIKPCMLLDSEGLCRIYLRRPASCRWYGLWPKEMYEQRVDKFEKAYSKYGLKREDLPLNTQCPYVKRVNETVPVTQEVISEMYGSLDKLDESVEGFSTLQIAQKENYRTFHDWVLYKIYGEEWLSKLTVLSMAADKAALEDQINAFKQVIAASFKDNDVPNIAFRPYSREDE